jgi:hypothetical protein
LIEKFSGFVGKLCGVECVPKKKKSVFFAVNSYPPNTVHVTVLCEFSAASLFSCILGLMLRRNWLVVLVDQEKKSHHS